MVKKAESEETPELTVLLTKGQAVEDAKKKVENAQRKLEDAEADFQFSYGDALLYIGKVYSEVVSYDEDTLIVHLITGIDGKLFRSQNLSLTRDPDANDELIAVNIDTAGSLYFHSLSNMRKLEPWEFESFMQQALEFIRKKQDDAVASKIN